MTSNLGQHLASYPCTAAGSRALAAHLRDDHGKTLFTSPYEEDHAVHTAMHAAAHTAEPCEPLCTCSAFHRPHPHHSPAASAGPEPAGDGSAGNAAHEHDRACASPQHGPDTTYREPLTPAYLRGVLTAEAELSDGSIGPDGWMLTASTSPVLVALSYADGTASLVTEAPDGHLSRLRIPGQAFLRLIDGAQRMLAASRAQSGELGQRHKPGQ